MRKPYLRLITIGSLLVKKCSKNTHLNLDLVFSVLSRL
jgi:hypothetical protein